MGVQMCFGDSVFYSFCYIPRNGIADHMVTLFSMFLVSVVLFSIVVAPFYIPTSNAEGFQFLLEFFFLLFLFLNIVVSKLRVGLMYRK